MHLTTSMDIMCFELRHAMECVAFSPIDDCDP